MKGRAYVMIFFFWALLTIITPMLVSWSQSLKTLPHHHHAHDDDDHDHHHHQHQGMEEEVGPRRMMGSYLAEMKMRKEIAKSLKNNEELMMEPSMAPSSLEDINQVLSSIVETVSIRQEEGLIT